MSRVALFSLLVVLACACIISVDAQTTCEARGYRSLCSSNLNCGWCEDRNLCYTGNSNGPNYGSCSCGNWYYNGSYRNSCASRAWVTAVWVTILVVVSVFCGIWYVRHRRRQLFYQQQAAANQNQATIITTQAGYASSGSPVMATAAQPVMATVASPVMAQPVYSTGAEGQPYQQPYQPQPGYQQQPYSPYQGQQQPMYATPAGYQQPPPGYQPQYAPVGEGGVVGQSQPAYVPAYGTQPVYMAQPVQGQPQSSS